MTTTTTYKMYRKKMVAIDKKNTRNYSRIDSGIEIQFEQVKKMNNLNLSRLRKQQDEFVQKKKIEWKITLRGELLTNVGFLKN